VAKCRIDSFRLRQTGSRLCVICFWWMLNSVMRAGFGFSNVTFRPSRVFHSRVSVTPVSSRHGRTEYWKLPAFIPNIQNVVTHFSCWHCLCTLFGPISQLYKQLLQYTLLKYFTVPTALLTKFPKKFHMKLLASDIIFTKLSTKTLFLWRCRVSFEYQGLLQNTPASFLLLFVNVQASL